MALVDWVLTCDFAYFDPGGRLCVIGADANRVRTVASGTHRLTVVAHLGDDRGQHLDPVLALRSPTGAWRAHEDGIAFTREQRGSCLLLHVPQVTLTEAGTYTFELALGTTDPVLLELSVIVQESRRQRVHLHGAC
ncbi:MAG TPA: hypothetical protein VLV86_05770 [Vicinamibacterales bacterium]|nr:hypothetical protein [Vicinamibacterales bacterium]